MKGDHAYVYAVVGRGKYSSRVDQSLRRLQSLTAYNIFVVAGKGRHDVTSTSDIIEVAVPADLNDHQASIWLKTSLHRHLPSGSSYCYLDSDILPIRKPDAIFESYSSPGMLARDHATIDQFSPYALHCGCLKQKVDQQKHLQTYIDRFANHSHSRLPKDVLEQQQARLHVLLSNQSTLQKWKHFLMFNLANRRYHLNNEFYFDKTEQAWLDGNDEIILYHEPNLHIQRHAPFTHDAKTGQWYNPDQEDIHDVQCQHLRERMSDQFGIATDGHERLWNGGLILFDDTSADFMHTWHQLAVGMLADPQWQTRDQAALFMAARKCHIDPMVNALPKQWNWLIADERDLQELIKSDVVPHFVHMMLPTVDDPSAIDELYKKLRRFE